MNVQEAIESRRAYRALKPFPIDEPLVRELAGAAALAASCFNKQPWRFVFVIDPGMLSDMRMAMNKGNEWTQRASLIVAVFTHRNLDCVVKEREYALFDTGMAVATMILKATELGLVLHPIAGFDEDKAKELLGIPADMRLITLLNGGAHDDQPNELMSEKQIEGERKRPPRLPCEQFAWIDRCAPAVTVKD